MDDIDVDEDLEFLDGFVQQAISQGAREYADPDAEEDFVEEGMTSAGLKIAYGSNQEEEQQKSLLVTDPGPMIEYEEEPQPVENEWGGEPARPKKVSVSAMGPWGDDGLQDVNSPKPIDAPASNTNETQGVTAMEMFSNMTTEQPMQTNVQQEIAAPIRRQPEPEKPKELTEKEKFQQALFGPAPSSSSRNRRSRNRKKRGQSKPEPEAAPVTDNLMGDMFGGMTTTTEPAAQAPPADSGLGNLLDFGAGPSTAAPATNNAPMDMFGGMTSSAPAPKPNDGGMGDLFGGMTSAPVTASPPTNDLFGGMMTSNPAPQSTGLDLLGGGATSAPSGGGDDIFGGLMSMSAPVDMAPAKIGSEACPPSISNRIGNLPRSQETDEVVGSDMNIRVGAYKVYTPNDSKLVLFVSNTSSAPINNINIKLRSNVLQIAFDSMGADECPIRLVNATTATIVKLDAGQTGVAMAKFGVNQPQRINFSQPIQGDVRYSSGQFSINCSFGAEDLIRPAKITTPQFQNNWKIVKGAQEQAAVMGGSVSSIQEYNKRLQKINIHPIQIIGQEAIAATQLWSMTNHNITVPVLIHATLKPGQLSAVIKTTTPAVAKGVKAAIEKVMR